MSLKDEAIARIKLDIEGIWKKHDRTGALSGRNLRWEGTAANPNGWRTMAHLANDLELILDEPMGETNERRERNGLGQAGPNQEHGNQQASSS
jgi:hypothetical protein